ncbi:hypothetical protein ACIRG4_09825 [Streptomyces sp. NPDC102395]|uniref:hypothetical protein n=1 Tax=Streptomyces sp. NPDC102395 TaxID=3366168 RepID=UPI0038029BD8
MLVVLGALAYDITRLFGSDEPRRPPLARLRGRRAALEAAWTVITATSRTRHAHRRARPGSLRDQLAAGVRRGLREAGRNRVLWVLLIAVPVVCVLLAVATTPDENTALTVRENGRTFAQQARLRDIHGGTMAPIAIGSLAALAGLFTILDARSGDRRLSLAGFRPTALLASRLAVVAIWVLVATAA